MILFNGCIEASLLRKLRCKGLRQKHGGNDGHRVKRQRRLPERLPAVARSPVAGSRLARRLAHAAARLRRLVTKDQPRTWLGAVRAPSHGGR